VIKRRRKEKLEEAAKGTLLPKSVGFESASYSGIVLFVVFPD